MSALIESLKKCRVEGNVLLLPPISEGALPNYNDVRTALLNAGAKYKRNTFVFASDAQPFIDRLTGGESVNIKKEFQFFGTPERLADKLVRLARIDEDECPIIGEPSAGQGALVKAIHRAIGVYPVFCYELMPENQRILKNIPDVKFLGSDFLNHEGLEFDYIIANPPFNKAQDIKHFRKMYDNCSGTVACIMSKGWMYSSIGEGSKFRKWLDDDNQFTDEEWHTFCNIGIDQYFERKNGDSVYMENVDAGEFKESGTGVATCIVVLTKNK